MTILKKVLSVNLLAILALTSCEKNDTETTAVSQDLVEFNNSKKYLVERKESNEFLVTSNPEIFKVLDCNLNRSNLKYKLFEKITPIDSGKGNPFTLQLDASNVFQKFGGLKRMRYTFYVDGTKVKQGKWSDFKNLAPEESLSGYRRAIVKLSPGDHTIKLVVRTFDKANTNALDCFFSGNISNSVEDTIEVFVPENNTPTTATVAVAEVEATTKPEMTTTSTKTKEASSTSKSAERAIKTSDDTTCNVALNVASSRKLGKSIFNAFQIDLSTVGENPRYEYFIDGVQMTHVDGDSSIGSRTVSFVVNTANEYKVSANSFRSTLDVLKPGKHVIVIKVYSDTCTEGGEVSYSFTI